MPAGRAPAWRSTARGPSVTGASPAGPPRHFCVPDQAASIPHASISTGTPPSDVTQSASSSAPWRWASSPAPSSGCSAPVEVSACTIAIALGFAPSSAASISSSEKTWPQGFSTRLTAAPRRSASSASRLPKKPARADQQPVARLEQAAEHRLHARHAGARHRERARIRRAEHAPEQHARLLEQLQQRRVEVAESRGREGPRHPRVDRARPGAQQHAGGRIQLAERVLHGSLHAGRAPLRSDARPSGRQASTPPLAHRSPGRAREGAGGSWNPTAQGGVQDVALDTRST